MFSVLRGSYPFHRFSPNSIDTIAVRRRVAGMKQILLILAVVG